MTNDGKWKLIRENRLFFVPKSAWGLALRALAGNPPDFYLGRKREFETHDKKRGLDKNKKEVRKNP